MRRTYRSKKETGSGLDPRDVVHTMNEKSSVFDAFYIQNIKQTKRELLAGASMIATSKVRKRKYVKRRQKEQKPIVTETAYLTPDKSIRVKREQDPFDLLLNSTSTNDTSSQKTKGKERTYKPQVNKKKLNYSSSDNSDLIEDKSFNSCSKNISIHNTSDVLSHKLQIEKENNHRSNNIDESIYNIVNDVSIFRKIHKCINSSPVMREKLSISSAHSSPLCSTPFHRKYNGKSIYKFSPILVNAGNITNDNIKPNHEDTNASLENKPGMIDIISNNENVADDQVFSPILPSKILNSKNTPKGVETSNCSSIKTGNYISSLETSEVEPFLGFSQISTTNLAKDHSTDKYINQSVIQSESLLEEMKGDSENPSVKIDHNHYLSEEVNDVISNQNDVNKSCVETDENYIGHSQYLSRDSYSENSNLKSIKDNLAKTNNSEKCHSIQNYDNNELSIKLNYNISNKSVDDELIIRNESVKRIQSPHLFLSSFEESIDVEKNNSDNEFFVENIASRHNIIEPDIPNVSSPYLSKISIDDIQHSLSEDISDDSADNESHYESCNSENNLSVNKDEYFNKKLLVRIERLNDSVFQNYYEKEGDYSIKSDKTYEITRNEYSNVYENDVDLERTTSSNEESFQSEQEPTTSHSNEYSNFIENDIDLERTSLSNGNTYEIEEDLCQHENNKSEEDICISFVTTRRKHEKTKESFISTSFDNSVTSASSGDFEKTVLSNNKNSVDNFKENIDVTLISSELKTDSGVLCGRNSLFQKSTSTENCALAELSTLPKKKRESNSKRTVVAKPSSISRKSYKRVSVHRESSPSFINRSVNHSYMKTRRSSQLNRKTETKEPILLNNVQIISPTKYQKPNQTDHKVCPNRTANDSSISEMKQGIVLQPGKRWERSLSIYRRMTTATDCFDQSLLEEEPLNMKGRKYRQSVITTMEMQDSSVSLQNDSFKSRRSSIIFKPSRSTIKIVRESNASSRISLCSTTASEDLQGFWSEDCDDTIVELSKLSIIDSEHEVTVLDNFNDTSNRITTARDYVLRRCNQTDVILFDECYPDTTLKNCRKIGEGVYGEVFLWRAGDGRARVLKIVPIAGTTKVNGESQKDYHEIISEIVIAMELSALRAPIIDIEKHLDEGKGVETLDLHSVENATDVFNEVLAIRCVYGSYPSRLLDLWELFDECKGSENDNPAILPEHQQYMVLELANAGQDLESYQFHNAEQAYALFKQVAYGLAVAEEAFQFEHRDLHWGNVLISPTDQKYATFVLRGRTYRVPRRGVAGTVIDYSLSRLSLQLPPADAAALYNDLAADDALFDAVGDYQFSVYRLMRDKLGNDWKNYEPYTNILWLHYTVDKMITSLRYTRTNTKIHKHYIAKLKEIKNRILDYGSAVQYVLTDNEL